MDTDRLKQLLAALREPRKLEQIGKTVVDDTLRRMAEVEQGKMPQRFAIALVFKKGDTIPDSFMGLPNLKVDVKGTLLEDWTDGWCQSGWNESGPWGDTWGECWDNTGPSALAGGMHFGYPVQWVRRTITRADFTQAELDVLKNYGIFG